VRIAACILIFAAAGCYQSAVDDDASPAASSIPTAAYSAIGADYPPPGGGTATTGIPECDAYFRKINNCRSVPPSARAALLDAAKAMRESIAQATAPSAKEAMRESCKAATEALSICDTNL
jgi:hypothetical protein